MILDELKYRIRSVFGHVPTAEQEMAIDTFARFMTDRNEQTVMVLRGAAGTGKTSLSAAIVQALTSLEQIATPHSDHPVRETGAAGTHGSCCQGVFAFLRATSLYHSSAHLQAEVAGGGF